MAAIGQDRANEIVAAAKAAGMTDEQLIKAAGDQPLDWFDVLSKGAAACLESDIAAFAAAGQPSRPRKPSHGITTRWPTNPTEPPPTSHLTPR
jgi:hypothetical protein